MAADPPTIWTEHQAAYTIPSKSRTRKRRLRLGLLPSRDGSAPRTANIIKPASHSVWALSSARELRTFFSDSFPQIRDMSSFMDDGESEQFVSSRAGQFPAPQYVPR